MLLTTRAAEHESYFSHVVGRVVFVSIQYADADLSLINMKRFQIFLETLLHMGGLNEDGSEGLPQCSNVMFLDTYDVFFQGNPFDSPRYSGSLTFTTESKSVGEDIWNAQWIYNCYIIEELKLLNNKTIANGGVPTAALPHSRAICWTSSTRGRSSTSRIQASTALACSVTGATCHPMPHTAAGWIKAF